MGQSQGKIGVRRTFFIADIPFNKEEVNTPNGKKTVFVRDPKIEKFSLDELRKYGLQKTKEQMFFTDSNSHEIPKMITDPSLRACEIGTVGGSAGHSISAFFGKEEILLYDSEIGLMSFKNRADLCEDIFRYIAYNVPEVIILTGFKEVAKT